jgi:sec-independent protein translocase protein TatB
MEKKWKAENERIMREFPQTVDMAALMAPKPQDVADADSAPVLVEQPTITPEPEPIHAAPETDPVPAPAPRKPRAKAAKKSTSPDTVEPTAPKPRARKPKAAAPVETSGD